MKKWFSALALIVLLALGSAQPAMAHASLISSLPENNALVTTSPERFILIFNEPVTPLRLQLVDRQGQVTVLSDAVQHNMSLILRPPGPLQQGTHLLSWRVVSSDGHPVGGTLIFSVGAPDITTPVRVQQRDPARSLAIWLTRIGVFVALLFGVGGAVFAQGVAAAPLSPRVSLYLSVLCLCGLAAVPLSVGLQGLDALDLPLAALVRADVWQTGFATTYGTSALLAGFALAAASLSVALRRRGLLLLPAAFAAVGFAFAASGHAAAATPQWLTRPSVWLHAVAAAFWLGSLWPLRAVLRADARGHGVVALRRFTIVIPWVLGLLVLSGATLAAVQLARPQALWATDYGLILCAKLAAVLALVALAAVNRFRLTPKLLGGEKAALPRLRRNIVAEIGLALLILGLAAGWRFTPPPRSIVPEEQSELVHFHSGALIADLTLTPGRAGRSTGEMLIRDGDYRPVTPKAVTLIFSQPASGIEPLRREAVSIGDARWRIDDIVLPTPGRWRLRIEVLIDDFTKQPLEDDILIRR